jgi:hypothetical protein
MTIKYNAKMTHGDWTEIRTWTMRLGLLDRLYRNNRTAAAALLDDLPPWK